MGHVKPGRKKKIVLVEKSRKKTRERVVHKCVLYLGMWIQEGCGLQMSDSIIDK